MLRLGANLTHIRIATHCGIGNARSVPLAPEDDVEEYRARLELQKRLLIRLALCRYLASEQQSILVQLCRFIEFALGRRLGAPAVGEFHFGEAATSPENRHLAFGIERQHTLAEPRQLRGESTSMARTLERSGKALEGVRLIQRPFRPDRLGGEEGEGEKLRQDHIGLIRAFFSAARG